MNGVVNLFKPAGISSFLAVKKVRRLFDTKKAGHTGTLDPMAEGVLPICLGSATKVVEYLTGGDKEYVASFSLGYSTDSYDTTGEKTAENNDVKPTFEDIKEIVTAMQGEIELPVPAYSAVKINGERAYKLARKGEIEDAGTRTMNVYSIELLSYEYPEGIISVSCAKGTYIRSIIHVLGQKSGALGCMSGLVRTKNGLFNKANSYTLEQLEEMKENGKIEEALTDVGESLDWEKAVVKDDFVRLVKNGVSVQSRNYLRNPETEKDMVFITSEDGKVLAVAKTTADPEIPFKISKVLV